jgi:glucose-1-phosphate thymidylyltransferase
MKGIILSAGPGTRLLPLTKVTNKCLLPVGQLPMMIHCLNLLVEAKITEIMLISSIDHIGQVISLLGSGSGYGCSITYKIQDKLDGIASALKLCKDFVGNDKCAVILGDNIFEDSKPLSKAIEEFSTSPDSYALFAKEVPDPHRFGVPVIVNDKVVDIVEKPKNPPCNKAIVGLYCYTNEVFDIIDGLQPSQRGEYEISDVNSKMVKNKNGKIIDVTCEWVDAGTHESYMKANQMFWNVK